MTEEKEPAFILSRENQLWYSYQNQSQLQFQKIEVLNQFVGMYPGTKDKIISQATKALALEKENYTFTSEFPLFYQTKYFNFEEDLDLKESSE